MIMVVCMHSVHSMVHSMMPSMAGIGSGAAEQGTYKLPLKRAGASSRPPQRPNGQEPPCPRSKTCNARCQRSTGGCTTGWHADRLPSPQRHGRRRQQHSTGSKRRSTAQAAAEQAAVQ